MEVSLEVAVEIVEGVVQGQGVLRTLGVCIVTAEGCKEAMITCQRMQPTTEGTLQLEELEELDILLEEVNYFDRIL